MKYIKIFENYNEIKEIELFINNNLAYVLDDYEVDVKDKVEEYGHDGRIKKHYIKISIKKSKFKWDQIKDDFIPFLELLNNSYKIKHIVFNKKSFIGIGWTYSYSNVEDILNDDVSIENNLREIIVVIDKN